MHNTQIFVSIASTLRCRLRCGCCEDTMSPQCPMEGAESTDDVQVRTLKGPLPPPKPDSSAVQDESQTGTSNTIQDLQKALVVARDTALDKRAAAREYSLIPGLKATEPTFVQTLMAALDDEQHNADVLTWMPDGKAFSILDTKKFESVQMPNIFNLRLRSSFFRKLHQWGFNRGFDRGSMNSDIFSHPNFQRGNKAALSHMKSSSAQRVTAPVKVKPSTPTIDKAAPSNYTMPAGAPPTGPALSPNNNDTPQRSTTAANGSLLNDAATSVASELVKEGRQYKPNGKTPRPSPLMYGGGNTSFAMGSVPSVTSVQRPHNQSGGGNRNSSSIDVAIQSLLDEREQLLRDTDANGVALKALMEQRDRLNNSNVTRDSSVSTARHRLANNMLLPSASSSIFNGSIPAGNHLLHQATPLHLAAWMQGREASFPPTAHLAAMYPS